MTSLLPAGRPGRKVSMLPGSDKIAAHHSDNDLGFRVVGLLHYGDYQRLTLDNLTPMSSPTAPIPDTEGALFRFFAFCLMTRVLSSSVFNLSTTQRRVARDGPERLHSRLSSKVRRTRDADSSTWRCRRHGARRHGRCSTSSIPCDGTGTFSCSLDSGHDLII